MKKLKILLCVFLFLLFSCAYVPSSSPTKEITRQESDAACKEGLLMLDKDHLGENVLPPAYVAYGKEEGKVRVGGDLFEGREDVPLITFHRPVYPAALLSITFTENPEYFEEDKYLDELGFDWEYIDAKGEEHNFRYRKKAEKFLDLVSLDANGHLTGEMVNAPDTAQLCLYPEDNTIGLAFFLNTDYKYKSFTIYYSDFPHEIENVAILQGPTEHENLLDKYDGSDCFSELRSEELPKDEGNEVDPYNPEYHLISSYGYLLSVNYLLSKYFILDEATDRRLALDAYKDDGHYFTKGQRAEMGEKFDVILYSSTYPEKGKVTLHIRIGDKRPPSLSLIKDATLEASYTTDFTNPSFINSFFRCVDNCDENLSFEVTESNGYPLDRQQLGKREVLLTAKDSRGNKASLPFSLSLYDDVPPVIETIYDELHLLADEVMTEEDLLSLLSAEDEIDGECSLSVQKNTYQGNYAKDGEYSFSVESSDKSGNTSESSLPIYVSTSGPRYLTKDNIFYFDVSYAPSVEEIGRSLLRRELLPFSYDSSFSFDEGNKIEDIKEKGTYNWTVIGTSVNGEKAYCDVVLKVTGERNDDTESTFSEEDNSFFSALSSFFRKLWYSLLLFFWKIRNFFAHLFGH